MSEEDQGRGPHARARRDPRLSRPRLSRAGAGRRRPSSSEMMDWLVCDRRARRVRPDDARGDGTRRARRARHRFESSRRRRGRTFPVVVIGCGQSGLLAGDPAARRPASRSRSSRRTPESAAPGGRTRYPGARVDVGNHFYCYSFEPSDHWTEFFAQQPELQAYFEASCTSTASTEHVRWDTEVLERDVGRRRRRRGRCAIRDADGTEETLDRARGDQRGRAAQPPEPARHPRRGHVRGPFVPLGAVGPRASTSPGKRVAMIGAGASGFQIAPTIADDVAQPHRVPAHRAVDVPEPELPRQVGPGRAVGAAPPAVLRPLVPLPAVLARLRHGSRRPRASTPTGRDQQRAVSEINDMTRMMFTEWITQPGRRRPRAAREGHPRLPGDRQAHAAGQRQLAAHADARQRRAGPRRRSTTSSPTRVVTVDGARHPADVIVYATGFHANRVLWPMAIIGRDGVDLREQWGERPAAYLGITVPGLPELLLHVRARHEPGARRQPDLPLGVPDALHHAVYRPADRRRPPTTMEPRQDDTTTGTSARQAEMDTLVWSQPTIKHSFYKNRHGEDPRAEPVATRRLLDLDPQRRTPTTSSSADARPAFRPRSRRLDLSAQRQQGASSDGRPTSWIDTGSPSRSRPHGTTAAGCPVTLNISWNGTRAPTSGSVDTAPRRWYGADARRPRRGARGDHHVDVVEDRQHPRPIRSSAARIAAIRRSENRPPIRAIPRVRASSRCGSGIAATSSWTPRR